MHSHTYLQPGLLRIEPNLLPCSHTDAKRVRKRVGKINNYFFFQNDQKLTNSLQPDLNPTFKWCWDQSELIRINPNRECSHANYNSNQFGLIEAV